LKATAAVSRLKTLISYLTAISLTIMNTKFQNVYMNKEDNLKENPE